MKIDSDQVRNTLSKHLMTLKDMYHVEKIGVFGSVARGDNTDTSDIDILVEFNQPIGMFQFIKLEKKLRLRP